MSRALSRREFVSLSVGASLALQSAPRPAVRPIVERRVEFKTADGLCDALYLCPTRESHPGVLIWHDSLGLRPAMRDLGSRIASEGYAVLVPNLFYRVARTPVFGPKFDMTSAVDRELYNRTVAPFLAPGAAERDAVAYVKFLDAQAEVNTDKKIGTHGYCLGGPHVLKAAAAMPGRIGAAVSFHGGYLVTDRPDSPHLLAPKIKARVYIAIASDDDTREPQAKETLRAAFKAANVQAEVELYPKALHGWCVPDSKAYAQNRTDAERAWARLIDVYNQAL